jgi:hypothetical protein
MIKASHSFSILSNFSKYDTFSPIKALLNARAKSL